MRHGGDLAGLVDTLDYLQGMGIKALYIAGAPFLNLPWKSDGYSPVDFTLLDHHFGRIADWRGAIDEIHRRGMYIILDNTFATMADLIGFDGFLNESTPFRPEEHEVKWKSDRQYPDFAFGNTKTSTCKLPRFWDDSGRAVMTGAGDANISSAVFDKLSSQTECYDSDFDQYGDTEAFGVFPDWQRQLSKFASVQDRLREWKPSVLDKLKHLHCLTISMLDIDGIRIDKATQATVDALADFSESIRECARDNGKQNFLVAGEITGSNNFGSIYLGRGREPDQKIEELADAVKTSNESDDKVFLRAAGKSALDASAFHYSIYRLLQRFLGMDGNLTVGYDIPNNFVNGWNEMLLTNDLVNANTGKFDPRHMYGTSNQDVFRWPTIKSGTEKMLLGLFMTTLHMPGIPLLNWGEEQALYTLDNTASNYVFGRQPISSSLAWQTHGCYSLGADVFYDFPIEAGANGCNDDKVSLDHRDPTHPIRNIIKSFYHLRTKNPILNDGWSLLSLSNQTREIFLPGSNGTATEVGMWCVMRNQIFNGVQNLTESVTAKPAVWLVYGNENHTVDYDFDCSSNDTALVSVFDEEDEVRNLLSPYDTLTLKRGPKELGIDGSKTFNGCLDKLTLKAWDFRAYVRKADWIEPAPMLTRFAPGHDARILSKVKQGEKESVDIEFQFSQEMDCDSITKNIVVISTTADESNPEIDTKSVVCSKTQDSSPPPFVGAITSAWSWKATLVDVSHGIHSLTVQNASTTDGVSTGSTDHVFFRIGEPENPMVFPRTANYSTNVLSKGADGALLVSHQAAGADRWRYSTNWGSSWSDWQIYDGTQATVKKQPWSGTKHQKWSGDHIILQYWSRTTGSSSHMQHADLDQKQTPRRFPHLYANGIFNQFGFDGGLRNTFKLSDDTWKFHLMTEWPHQVQVNVWGINPDGKPDQSFIYGDVDNDTVLDRLPPDALSPALVNLTDLPPSPYLAYRISIDDATYKYKLIPAGSRFIQILVFALLWSIPVLTGAISIWTYMGAFYGVKFNKIGLSMPKGMPSFWNRHKFSKIADDDVEEVQGHRMKPLFLGKSHQRYDSGASGITIASAGKEKRRKVIIATMEYDISDWNLKVKIGGLGVMAQLMGKSLTHQDLIWVVPCVGGIEYPVDQIADPMIVTILGSPYEIQVQYHQLENITYVLLDAPIFRQQTKAEPYPPRMDDLDSAVYYSAWNACIAETIKRFEPDIYHINDYHGCAAPLYLLPETIPCCLSLHNAEFQGLWPMRTDQEQDEVSRVYNLDKDIIQKYVQFGEVFNLLHAGVSYLRVHQKGFGAVGVSNKYGARSFARYPIFWGLKEIGKLPNPDPSDTLPWNREEEANQVITVDPAYEASRGDLRRQAQEWAGLEIDPTAELFVFVGRWSNQKGVDLIADVFPHILEKHKKVQLICVGPVIDLYGKFAALKLEVMMKKYPKRVYSKPEFTALPPFIFSGAEFALIPSRDEPFGLVAVEFGRKGALGVGARVGGLGQMPGWWFTVESTTTAHLIHQFKSAIEDALAAKTDMRAMMRARSAKQRFPVQKWVEDLNILQSTAIRIHQREANYGLQPSRRSVSNFGNESSISLAMARDPSPSAGPVYETQPRTSPSPSNLNRTLSLGSRAGPGHHGRTPRVQITDADISEDDEDLFGSEYSLDMEEATISREAADNYTRESERADALDQLEGRGRGDSLSAPQPALVPGTRSRSPSPDPRELYRGRSRNRNSEPYLSVQTDDRTVRRASADSLLPVADPRDRSSSRLSNSSRLSTSSQLDLTTVVGSKKDYSLQKIELNFDDKTGEYYRAFETMLDKLNGKTSEKDLCIEEYLVDSEKAWFKKYRDAKLGRAHDRGSSAKLHSNRMSASPHGSGRSSADADERTSVGEGSMEDFLLGDNYQRPSLVKRWMLTRLGDWPLYSFLLALGQIMAANSYQITLLTGGEDPKPSMIYTIGGIYIASSVVWWLLFRRVKARFVLSVPFVMYGLAFLFLGMAPFLPKGAGRDWMQNVADGIYAAASASGSLYFALNFGDEGGSPISSWVYRACIIQGTQQIYITGLFYWGRTITKATPKQKIEKDTLSSSPIMAAITLPIAALLWLVALTLFTSLPAYYQQRPGKIPSFYKTLARRKLISWFFVAVILQNYFLSSQYGRSWQYLWSSNYAPVWVIAILVLVFFIIVWALMLFVFSKLSKSHSWILPIFAIGLLAPRWAQQWWGTSGFGLWLPWMPGGAVGGAIAGRALWLWLGVLDAVQGVGFGMMLLQTLTRIHIGVTLISAQVLGTAVMLIAKATAPNRNGPGDVFPDLSAGVIEAISKPWFWIALACQLVIPIGFFKFFRKEQLSKP
ncbi:putative alpha 1,3 glucan synthase [Aureobasidium pullulans]|nr:putative alpha 1,3 glucan synthase [Aureobasidium pullulans]